MQVPQSTYVWPMAAFSTALVVNLMTVISEGDKSLQLVALLGCYINGVAAMSDWLSWMDMHTIRKVRQDRLACQTAMHAPHANTYVHANGPMFATMHGHPP